jgi:N-acetylglutamate synthase-like GNAT family acetyltransferase
MEKMELDLGKGQEATPTGVINAALIDEMLGRLKLGYGERPVDEYQDYYSEELSKYLEYDTSFELTNIFKNMYDEGKTVEDEKKLDKHGNVDLPYLEKDFWDDQSLKDNLILLSTLESLLVYKSILGPKVLKKLFDDIYDRWFAFTTSTAKNEYSGFFFPRKMKQIVFVSLLSLAEDSRNAGLEDYGHVDVLTIDDDEKISISDIYQMEEIYKANYSDKPELQEILLKGFRNNIGTRPQNFILVRFEGDVIGYYELENLGDNKIHFGKFNVSPGLGGVGIGNLLLDKKLNIEAEKNIIFAECDLFAGASRNYLKNGFVAYKISELAEIEALSIARNDSFDDLFKSKNIDIKDFVNKDPHAPQVITDGETNSSHGEFNYIDDNIVVVKFPWWDDPRDSFSGDQLANNIKDFLNGKKNDKKYVITKIFEYKIDKAPKYMSDTYFVFESIGEKELDSYLNEFK